MHSILVGFLVGGFSIAFIINKTFRHIVLTICIYTLEIPLSILKWLDKVTCHYIRKMQPTTVKEESVSSYVPKETRELKIKAPKEEPITNIKTPEGKIELNLSDKKLQEWLDKNPALKEINKGVLENKN